MERGLTDSEQALAGELARDPLFLAGLARLGPVPGDVLALCEAYIGFLRHAPSLNPPPVLWAVALVHRHTAELYARFSSASPDLAARLDAAFARPDPFFSGDYLWVRSQCLERMSFPDVMIWPSRAEALTPPPLVLWVLIATMIVVASCYVMPLAVTRALLWSLLIGGLGGLTVGWFWDTWRQGSSANRKTPARTPEVLRVALFHARHVRCTTAMAEQQVRFERVMARFELIEVLAMTAFFIAAIMAFIL